MLKWIQFLILQESTIGCMLPSTYNEVSKNLSIGKKIFLYNIDNEILYHVICIQLLKLKKLCITIYHWQLCRPFNNYCDDVCRCLLASSIRGLWIKSAYTYYLSFGTGCNLCSKHQHSCVSKCILLLRNKNVAMISNIQYALLTILYITFI